MGGIFVSAVSIKIWLIMLLTCLLHPNILIATTKVTDMILELMFRRYRALTDGDLYGKQSKSWNKTRRLY